MIILNYQKYLQIIQKIHENSRVQIEFERDERQKALEDEKRQREIERDSRQEELRKIAKEREK